MSEPLLTVHGLSAGYEGVPLFDGVGFNLSEGGILFLEGSNGVGKSTLLDVLTWELPPLRGEVRILGPKGGPDLVFRAGQRSRGAHRARAAGIVRTYQRARIVDLLTGGENAALSWRASWRRFLRSMVGRDEKADLSVERHILLDLGHGDVVDQMGAALSAGQARAAELARALAANSARLLVFDEPLANLHRDHVPMFSELLIERCRAGVAALIVEHRGSRRRDESGLRSLLDADGAIRIERLNLDDYAMWQGRSRERPASA